MQQAVRPTLRCLDDLVEGLEDAEQRRAVESARFSALPPLHEIAHPLVKHCVNIFAANDSELERETISSAKSVMFYKAKTGQWRGAVYIDPATSQTWIVAAGLRREGDSDDFYRTFADLEHAALLPGAADREHLAIEQATARLAVWQREVRTTAITAIGMAATAHDDRGRLPIRALDDSLAGHLDIEVVRLAADIDEAHETPAELLIEIRLGDWKHERLRREAIRQIALVVAPNEDAWDSIPMPGGVQAVVARIAEARLLQLIAACHDDDSATDSQLIPDRIEPTEHAHFAPKNAIVDASIHGLAIRGRCGRWFVPSRDPMNLPVCPRCEAIHAQG